MNDESPFGDFASASDFVTRQASPSPFRREVAKRSRVAGSTGIAPDPEPAATRKREARQSRAPAADASGSAVTPPPATPPEMLPARESLERRARSIRDGETAGRRSEIRHNPADDPAGGLQNRLERNRAGKHEGASPRRPGRPEYSAQQRADHDSRRTEFGAILRDLRGRANMSLAEMARLTGQNGSSQARSYEGRCFLPGWLVAPYAEIFDVSARDLGLLLLFYSDPDLYLAIRGTPGPPTLARSG